MLCGFLALLVSGAGIAVYKGETAGQDHNRHVRQLLLQRTIDLEIILHAAVEALKDGLEAEDLEFAVYHGKKIEDYGNRALLLAFTPQGNIPFHIVLEYVEGDLLAFIVTAYVPESHQWQKDWKTRKRKKGKRKK